ncbi:MAG: radical SAM protein [Sedimentisphaerales bacterium]|nr:radical SAM protein [Sedimentisphaerales bacterium]
MKPKILLVNPAIYDFAAFDFWLRPYGMLEIAGFLRGKADFELFDYLDRLHPFMADNEKFKSDRWGRGRFFRERIKPPKPFVGIPRYFRRFGLPRKLFAVLLESAQSFDHVFIQTTMTYWYPGIAEVIEDVRKYQPDAKIILGGNYVTICPEHAKTLGADLLVYGTDLRPLWDYIGAEADLNQPALWEIYPELKTVAIKISDGCPFSCTYCSVPKVYGGFAARSLERALAELELMVKLGAENIAFYDDALLYKADEVLIPFLEQVLKRNIKINFHTPNALNARFVTKDLADLMVRAGFKTFYLGFESSSIQWQKQTGSKVFSEELAQSVEYLKLAGADLNDITAYQILGHPSSDIQQLEESMRFVAELGIRGMLADFSPIPGTPDGDACSKWVDLSEPLLHNKTAFTIIRTGFDESNRLKDLQRKLNRQISH